MTYRLPNGTYAIGEPLTKRRRGKVKIRVAHPSGRTRSRIVPASTLTVIEQ